MEEGRQLEEVMRKQYKEKEDQYQRLEDELRKKRSQLEETKKTEKYPTIKELKKRISYYKGLEAKINSQI